MPSSASYPSQLLATQCTRHDRHQLCRSTPNTTSIHLSLLGILINVRFFLFLDVNTMLLLQNLRHNQPRRASSQVLSRPCTVLMNFPKFLSQFSKHCFPLKKLSGLLLPLTAILHVSFSDPEISNSCTPHVVLTQLFLQPLPALLSE